MNPVRLTYARHFKLKKSIIATLGNKLRRSKKKSFKKNLRVAIALICTSGYKRSSSVRSIVVGEDGPLQPDDEGKDRDRPH